jgi:histidinol phosphatase-like PHP family hydrolase
MNQPQPMEKRPPLKQSRPARRQMVATLKACDLILATVHQKEDLAKAFECLARLTADDLVHARAWLETPNAIAQGFSLDTCDKIVALIESLERVRPRVEHAAAAAKVRGALEAMAKEAKPEDVAKLKAQVEN